MKQTETPQSTTQIQMRRKQDILDELPQQILPLELAKLEVAVDTRNLLHSIFCELTKINRSIESEVAILKADP